ncbi:11422_t:CDS:1, partial [Cetraspora pellucida]
MSKNNTSEHMHANENTDQPQQSVTNNVATTYNKKTNSTETTSSKN